MAPYNWALAHPLKIVRKTVKVISVQQPRAAVTLETLGYIMPFVNVWAHAVWSTKNRQPLMERSVRAEIFKHIFENGWKKGLGMARVNGYFEHVHALFSLSNDISISKAIQLLKGESSYWINKNSLTKTQFGWQDEYFVKSVSPENLRDTCQYIDNQEEHHQRTSFLEEYEKLIQEFALIREVGLKSIQL
jgi:putative transposase